MEKLIAFSFIYGGIMISAGYCQYLKANKTTKVGSDITLECNITNPDLWIRGKNKATVAFPHQFNQSVNGTKNYFLIMRSNDRYDLQILNISSGDEDNYCCLKAKLMESECIYVHVKEAPQIYITTTDDNVLCVVNCSQKKYVVWLEHFSFSGTLLRSHNASCENNTEISMNANKSYQTDGIYRCNIYSEFLDSDGKTMTLTNKKEATKRSSKTKCFNNTPTQQEEDDDVKFYIYGYNASHELIVYENDKPINDFQAKNSSMKLTLFGKVVDVNVTVIHVTTRTLKETRSIQHFTLKFADNTTCAFSNKLNQLTENKSQPTAVIEIYILSCCGGVVFIWILTAIWTKVKCNVSQ